MNNKFLNLIGIIAVVASIVAARVLTRGYKMDIGIKTENMDMSVRPGDNFYDYATRTWRNANPIPDDYSRFGVWEMLEKTNVERVRDIAERDNGKIGRLYKIAMDADKLNADGVAPVMPYLAMVDEIKSRDALPAALAKLHRFSSSFWGDAVALDEKDSEHFLYNITQGGIGLARDYFFDGDEKSVNVRAKYREFIARITARFGIAADAEKLYAFEERMAKSFFTKEKLRDPHANYHKMSRAEFKTKFPGFDWDTYLTARGASAAEYINVCQPSATTESVAILNDTDLDDIKNYLKYRIICSAAAMLDDDTYEIAFDFYNRTLSGQKVPKPCWKRAVAMLDGSLGEMVGKLYVEKYFPQSAKERMVQLVENLRRAYAMRIKKLDWMSDDTKSRALEKLNGFRAKIGYPDKWRDYGALEIRNDTLWDNAVRVAMFEDDFWLSKIGAKNDPTLWYMNAHEVNAYYDPSTNEICFPAGILQYPFFDMSADDAFNYGAIGAIIGHEMTHGFDDAGRQFDATGNLCDWWTETDAAAFNARADVMRKFFDGIEVAPGVHANGTFTLGENLADYGGVTIAYTAYKNFGTPLGNVDGMTDDMRFFVAYAGAWAMNRRPDSIITLTKTDEHSLESNRVNGILPHIDAWYDAFGVSARDKMYIAPDKRVHLW